jgi:hypothetical protein
VSFQDDKAARFVEQVRQDMCGAVPRLEWAIDGFALPDHATIVTDDSVAALGIGDVFEHKIV